MQVVVHKNGRTEHRTWPPSSPSALPLALRVGGAAAAAVAGPTTAAFVVTASSSPSFVSSVSEVAPFAVPPPLPLPISSTSAISLLVLPLGPMTATTTSSVAANSASPATSTWSTTNAPNVRKRRIIMNSGKSYFFPSTESMSTTTRMRPQAVGATVHSHVGTRRRNGNAEGFHDGLAAFDAQTRCCPLRIKISWYRFVKREDRGSDGVA